MNDVEKKLVEEARQYFNSIPVLDKDKLDGHIIHAYVIGGLKSREAILEEVLEWMQGTDIVSAKVFHECRNHLESKLKGSDNNKQKEG